MPPAILAVLGGILLTMVTIIAWPVTEEHSQNKASLNLLAAAISQTNSVSLNKSQELKIELALPATNNHSEAATLLNVIDENISGEIDLTVKAGDTLGELFDKNNLSYSDMLAVLNDPTARKYLTRIKPNDQLWIQTLNTDNEFLGLNKLTYNIDLENSLQITRDSKNNFTTTIESTPLEKRIAYAHGTITDSLFLAGLDAGLEDSLIMNLVGIYQWDIDFVKDIRKNDSFTLVYEEFWKNGERIRSGEILAAEFINAGDAFQAIRFTDDKNNSNYFTPDGKSLRKAFLRAPIAFSARVTSNFNPKRYHPVHKKVRPHRGVDYGGPIGTPILAAGDGKVIFRGRKGGYGNTVILQHGGNITTLYAHLSRFNKNTRSGRRVKQGQVIGYLGASGTVTAKHLHYEYRLNGAHRNPRTVKLPNAKPLPKEHKVAFEEVKQSLLAQLDVIKRANLVLAQKSNGASSGAVAAAQ